MAATTRPTNGVLLTSPSLPDLGFRRSALQMLVEIRQALHFLYIHIVHTVEAFRAGPVTDPVLGVAHRVRDFELSPAVHHPNALHDVKLFTRRNTEAALIHPMMITPKELRVDDERLAVPSSHRLAV